MPTILLLPLLISAEIAALVLLWPRAAERPAGGRLVVEFVVAIGALTGLLVALLMVLERLPWPPV